MNYETAKTLIQERVAKSTDNIGIYDLYSMILSDDLHVVLNMIAQLEMATSEERETWDYAYLLGQAIGNLDTAESILIYFGKTMGEGGKELLSAFEAINARLVALHPKN